MNITPKLSEIVDYDSTKVVADDKQPLTLSNIDDVFTDLAAQGIQEVIVNRNEMLMIAKFMVANCDCSDTDGNYDVKAWKVLSEGKVDTFLGVKLQLG